MSPVFCYRLVRALCAFGLAGTAMPALAAPACTATARVATDAGPYSPAAVNAGKVPAIAGSAGLTCDSSFVVVLGGNYIQATLSSLNGMKLKNGAQQIGYAAFADANGTVPLTAGVATNYAQNNVVNAAGLLGGSTATLPLYVKPAAGVTPPVGTYTDVITIAWNWKLCRGLYVAGSCVGTLDTGTASSEITVTLRVQRQDMTIVLSSAATWDAVNGTVRPLALPGSKGRTSLMVRNPDLVALDDGSIALIYKVPAKTSVALDGDGTSSSTVFGYTDGSPASGTTLTYTAGSATDDVDFSADNGASWTYSPTAGNRMSEAAVTHLRFRPKGAMKAGSSFTLSLPYLVR